MRKKQDKDTKNLTCIKSIICRKYGEAEKVTETTVENKTHLSEDTCVDFQAIITE